LQPVIRLIVQDQLLSPLALLAALEGALRYPLGQQVRGAEEVYKQPLALARPAAVLLQ
jgi:hypothetical protein